MQMVETMLLWINVHVHIFSFIKIVFWLYWNGLLQLFIMQGKPCQISSFLLVKTGVIFTVWVKKFCSFKIKNLPHFLCYCVQDVAGPILTGAFEPINFWWRFWYRVMKFNFFTAGSKPCEMRELCTRVE